MATSSVIANANFEAGDTGWTKGGHWTIVTGAGTPYEGLWNAQINTDDPGVGAETSEMYNDNKALCGEGQSITATARVAGFGADGNVAAVYIEWLNSSSVRISKSQGNLSAANSPGTWEVSTVTAVAPAGTAYARVGAYGVTVENGSCKIDAVSWNYTNDRTATLTSPVDGTDYTEGDTVLLSVDITGTTPDVDYVEYKDGATVIATTDTAPYNYNVTSLSVGTHSITAVVHLISTETITTAAASIEILAIAPPVTTREFRASNSYAYLISSNFSGLTKAMPLTARVTGIELEVSYLTNIMIRAKDYDIVAAGSDPNVFFDITNSGLVEAVLLDQSGDSYSIFGSSISGSIGYVRTDYDIVEEGTSEGKKWLSLENTDVQTVTIGGEDSLFGLPSIAASDFLEKSVGLRFYPVLNPKPVTADSGDAVIRFQIGKMRLRIYFDAGSAEYYFASADKTKVIKGELVSAALTDGDYETGDAEGVLQLTATLEVMDGSQTWVGDDWTIHAAYPPTDDNQIGEVADRSEDDGIGMAYNGLPSYSYVVDNRSRYQFITANFYAVKSLDSIYGAHGLPRAFAYNGDNFYNIYTQADPAKDQPRHVAYHHGHLALGYDDGRVDISVIGQPYNFDGALGASEWSIGDKVTGLLPLSGTILGIFGSKSIWGLSGTTVDNFATQVVTPNIGAIEYTVTDMGFPVYANAYGIYTLSQTQQYGDYLGTPMSQDISVLSMTLNAGSQSAPTFSFQQYTVFNEEDG